jgi:hypothetical protein
VDWRRKFPASIVRCFNDFCIHKTNREVFEKKVTIREKAQEASYLVAELIAQKMKSHIIAESLIMPACKIIVRKMTGKEAESEIGKVPVSDNTVSRRMVVCMCFHR